MSALAAGPSPIHVAVAIEAAAALLGDPPRAILAGVPRLQARAYAVESLMRLFPELDPAEALRLAGAHDVPEEESRCAGWMNAVGWQPQVVEAVVRVLTPPAPIVEAAAARGRVIRWHGPTHFTASLMGDPPAGRSALDAQRSQPTAGAWS